ncbi:flavin reductase family protein [Peredibacter starrii]|uniref:Flavin reductase family protein n=1 Tax=Peredibacter starrii TaxID=28202 RepID=A0AAX4HR95_9BACT|nr:flavin reductase family protein [Peredibacter starrii]WPU65697.1 flavin reductase family protein [Peredibacter starrii]
MKTYQTTGAFADNYKFLIGSIIPRPIAVISTRNIDGSNNLAPFSFFTAVSASPMIIAFCPMIRTSNGEFKDTVKNILREKEFVVNFCTESNYTKVNLASTELPYGEDEFKFSGLTPIDSEVVKAKRLLESPIQFECEFRDMLCYGKVPGSGSLITGEVKLVHVDENIMKDGKIVTDLLKAVGRGAGNDWFKTDSRFEMERLTKAQIQK